MRSYTLATPLALLALLAACADQPVTPVARTAGPQLASAKACAESPTVVVHTDPELRAAVASASAGDVIAISGDIPIDSLVTVLAEGITITCAEPGAGLHLSETNVDGLLLDLWVGNVTISGLVLDAEYGFAAVVAAAVDEAGLQNIRLTGNEIGCGYTFCVFLVGVPYLQVTDNHFEGDETLFGVQIQAAGPGLVVSRNVIENHEAYPATYGGIRARSATGATITHNEVTGWSHGIVLTDVYDSRVEHNRIDGSLGHGINFLLINASRVSFSGVSVKGNQITNSGATGMTVRGACWNTFEGNNVQENPVGARFEATTGANVYRGNHEVVQDAGAFDCDLDGDIDPNQISGAQVQGVPNAASGPSFSAGAAGLTRGGRNLPAVQ